MREFILSIENKFHQIVSTTSNPLQECHPTAKIRVLGRSGGGDKMHDYFYHNLGQVMTLTAADGTDLNLQPTEELAFAGAHLYGYSYLYDKKVAATSKDVKATFIIDMKDKGGDDIVMNLWMKGEPDREVFTALSPMTEGFKSYTWYAI